MRAAVQEQSRKTPQTAGIFNGRRRKRRRTNVIILHHRPAQTLEFENIKQYRQPVSAESPLTEKRFGKYLKRDHVHNIYS
jgi:hypothetical protein